jgi:hypothetical protein
MADSFLSVEPRRFKPISVPGLPDEAREAVNAALKTLSSWRNDLADASEKNGKQTIERMAAAAAALHWPEQIVDTARTQMKAIAEMQIRALDQMIDAWEEQLKSPNLAAASPAAMLSKLQSLPGFAPAGGMPGIEAWQNAANPMQMWMQFADQWQKSWTQAMTAWGRTDKPRQ